MDYDKRNAIKLILLSQLFQEQLDEFRGTTIYNHSIKNLLGKIEKHLDTFNRQYYNSIYSDDVANATNVLDTIIDTLVHSVVVEVSSLKEYNLFLINTPNGVKKIKSTLGLKEFKEKYKLKK